MAAIPASADTAPLPATHIYQPWNAKLFADVGTLVAAGNQLVQPITLTGLWTSRTGDFQENQNGKWVTLQKLTWSQPAGAGFSNAQVVKTPLHNDTTTRQYRYIVDATKYEQAFRSAVTTVSFQNPAQYTGYKLQSYNYMKAYCPRQIIELKSPGTSYAWSPTHKIQIATGMEAGPLKFVSLHECAHIRQFMLYNDDIPALQKRMNQIFGGSNGLEQAADCMAVRMGGNPAYAGYTKNCTGARGAAAATLLAGKKP
jgi:hypothetical protein